MSNTYTHKNRGKMKHNIKKEGRLATRKELAAAYPQLHSSNGKGSPIATCNCLSCKLGRKASYNKQMIRSRIRSNRQETRRQVWVNDGEGVEYKIPVVYTD